MYISNIQRADAQFIRFYTVIEYVQYDWTIQSLAHGYTAYMYKSETLTVSIGNHFRPMLMTTNHLGGVLDERPPRVREVVGFDSRSDHTKYFKQGSNDCPLLRSGLQGQHYD